MRRFITILLFLLSTSAFAQVNTSVSLSKKHQRGIAEYKDYTDSTELSKKARRKALRQARREARQLSKHVNLDGKTSRQIKEGMVTADVLSDTSKMKENALQTVSTQADKHVGQMDEYRQVSEIRNELEKYGGDITQLPETISELKDTENLGNKLEEGLIQHSELSGIQSQQQELEMLRDTPAEYASEMEKIKDAGQLREEMIRKAKSNATQYVMKHSDQLSNAQKSLSKLKRKYLSVPNANDLSTATKRNSLKGKPLKDRLYITGNFQILNSDPFSLDGMLSVGYKFNKKFVVGTNGVYRQTFGHYDRNITYPTAAENLAGYGMFTRYELKKGLFTYAEAERMNVEIRDKQNDTSYRIWTTGVHAGLGRTFSFTKLFKTQVLFLYNFTHQQNNQLYPGRFIVKFGFELNEKGLGKGSKERN